MNSSLIDVLCKLNRCKVGNLAEQLQMNPEINRKFVQTLTLQTTHLRPVERNFLLKPAFITRKPATILLAIRGSMAATVNMYYYLRHGRRLSFPKLPCVAVKGGRGHLSFYPLELLSVVAEEREKSVSSLIIFVELLCQKCFTKNANLMIFVFT